MRFPIGEGGQKDLADRNIVVINVTTENIKKYRNSIWTAPYGKIGGNPPADPARYTYRVGVGDQLRVQTWTTPERTQSVTDANVEGPIVDETGRFFYPFVGAIRAQGRTITQIREDLTNSLLNYIADPQVEVSVQTFNAHRVTITGDVKEPGATVLTNVPLRLLDLVNKTGVTETSDLRHVLIRRRGVEHRVSLQAFMEKGTLGHNPILLPNDFVLVPTLADNKIFTFGEIETTEIVLGPVRKSLTEVLADVGGIDRVRADARGIFIFRRTPETPDGFHVFQFNMQHAEALVLASEFVMAPLDIVFVTSDPITRWNDTVNKMISPLSGFVQARAVAGALSE